MQRFDKLIAWIVIAMAAVIAAVNLIMLKAPKQNQPLYKVELNRIEQELKNGQTVTADSYPNIIGIYEYDGSDDFYECKNEYVIRIVNGNTYRIEYTDKAVIKSSALPIAVNSCMGGLCLILTAVLFYIRRNIVKPFGKISDLPYDLAKGTLTAPVKENKGKYFGKLAWGLDMLRQELEQAKQRDRDRAKKEKTLLLSLSHDIKTPLSAVKLYSKALSKGLYPDAEKQREAAESINSKADEIEGYVAEMIGELNSDVLTFDFNNTEFYLADVISRISDYYSDKLSVLKTDFTVAEFGNCLISGDPDRLEEVLQNIIENAVKYGDGGNISIDFSDEENCRLITVSNSGCTLADTELNHIFDSFWRGSNTGSQQGSGLGLYICRQLMNGMGGDIFAEIDGDLMKVTVVCSKPQ
ncbi:HAMP domain-containing sensor histidine kinase [Ruminococcus sp.]|uniref:HAMP domain-containing sensor histidine kinase n=1 Tax=Ruminococcus sp. TaxID=41978 RepID=UPI0025E4468A|nr:HAMP domain-containing sensor histidine kinase [Ruminococcus sp.]MCR4639427.1 HAMP domain-containing histidine kinase [Ruminococcus sp.]